MSVRSIGYIVGSLSPRSINRRLALALRRLAPEAGLDLFEIPLRDLPLFSIAIEEDYPQAALRFKQSLSEAEGLIILTPEYNRSIPGVLKNALDVASRPRGTSPFTGKPSAVIGASPGPIATAVAQQHLRSILSFLGSPELAQPEAYIQYHPGLVDDDHLVTVDRTAALLRTWLHAVRAHVDRHCPFDDRQPVAPGVRGTPTP